jgi:hypothetical protein
MKEMAPRSHQPVLAAFGALLAAALLCAGTARAAGPAAEDLDFVPEGWFVPVGVNVGLALHDRYENSWLLGGEASLVYLETTRMLWFGGFVDGLYDNGSATYRVCAGPEFGFMFGGVEVGYLAERFADGWHHGVRAGVVATIAFLSLYGRFGFLFNSPDEPTVGEIGVLAKFPLPLGI